MIILINCAVVFCKISGKQYPSCKMWFIASKPACTTNVTNGSLLLNEWMEVKCVANIGKRGKLSMNCQNVLGSPVGIPGVTTANSTSTYVKVDGPPVLQPYVCKVAVGLTLPPASPGSLACKTTISYTVPFTTPTVNVCK